MEDPLVLTIAALVRKRALVAGTWVAGPWLWILDREDAPHATISFEANLKDVGNAWVRLNYNVSGEPVDYRGRLEAAKPN
jgi:hypothetical protein